MRPVVLRSKDGVLGVLGSAYGCEWCGTVSSSGDRHDQAWRSSYQSPWSPSDASFSPTPLSSGSKGRRGNPGTREGYGQSGGPLLYRSLPLLR